MGSHVPARCLPPPVALAGRRACLPGLHPRRGSRDHRAGRGPHEHSGFSRGKATGTLESHQDRRHPGLAKDAAAAEDEGIGNGFDCTRRHRPALPVGRSANLQADQSSMERGGEQCRRSGGKELTPWLWRPLVARSMLTGPGLRCVHEGDVLDLFDRDPLGLAWFIVIGLTHH